MTRDEEGPTYEVLRARTVVWLAVLMFAIGVGVAAWLMLAYGRGDPQNSLEAIKTAGTIVIGSGGAVALWLAVRRQRTAELAIAQKDRELRQKDRDQAHTARDAVERRVTELYTMAAVQLGSEHAHVRIAGVYALERLAQSNPDQRQVIVNVLCAYLRMPHTSGSAEPDPDRELRATQERQVRLTVQRVLATHLRPGRQADAFWPDITLDLAGATLLDVDLGDCHVHSATFDGARFDGVTDFSMAEFTGPVSFDNAWFTGRARFANTVWAEPADFTRARFAHEVDFGRAAFGSNATFEGTQFEGDTDFRGTRFDFVWFDDARFAGTAKFNGARFTGSAHFGADTHNATHFNGRTYFRAAHFDMDVVFSGVHFAATACFDEAVFSDFVGFDDAVFADSALFFKTKLLAEARFRGTRFHGDAVFKGSEFGRHANFDSTLFGAEVSFSDVTFAGIATCSDAYARLDVARRIWPPGWLLATPPDPDSEQLPGMPGSWGRLYDR